MEAFEDRGWFWLPDAADRTNHVTGTFTFDGDQVRLELDDPLVRPVFDEPEDTDDPVDADAEVEFEIGVVEESHPIIHGYLKNHGDVTILEATGKNLHGFFGSGTSEAWTSFTALLGEHSDASRFESTTFAFDLLAAWTDPPAITRKVEAGQHLDLELTELERAQVGDVAVTLLSGWNGSYGTRRVEVERRCWVRVQGPAMTANQVLRDWVMPLQDLLIVLLGRSVRISSVTLTPEGKTGRDASRMVFGGLRTGAPADVESIHLRGWGAPTLFTRHELPLDFDALMNGWMSAWAKYRDAIVQSQSSFHAPFMYAENQYAARFLGVEQLGRVLHPGSQVPKDEHQERVKAVIDAATSAGVKGAVLDWATGVLKGANNIPPRQLIEKLLAEEPGLFDQLLEIEPKFAQRATAARNGVAHPGAAGRLTVARRYWYGEVLLLLVRVRLLVEAGLSREAVHAAVAKRGAFQHALDQLANEDV